MPAAETEKVRYVIVGCPRSGTTAIHLALKGHPQVSALNDEMRITPFFDRGITAFTFGHEPAEERRTTQRALFDAITSAKLGEQTRALGLKVCTQNTKQAQIFVAAMRESFPDAKVILVEREDLVAQYGSLQNARRTGVWHSWYTPDNKAATPPRKLNPWLFRRYALECLDVVEMLRGLQASHSVFVCKYSALEADETSVHRSAIEFLGLDDVPITWFQAKKLMPPPQSYITNYAELTDDLTLLREQHAVGAVSFATRQVYRAVTLALKAVWLVTGPRDTGPG
jgi:hypothetical protein